MFNERDHLMDHPGAADNLSVSSRKELQRRWRPSKIRRGTVAVGLLFFGHFGAQVAQSTAAMPPSVAAAAPAVAPAAAPAAVPAAAAISGSATATRTANRQARPAVVFPATMPQPSTVGTPAQAVLSPMAGSQIVGGGVYVGVLVTGQIEIGKGQAPVTFRNCRIEGSIVTFSPLNLDACTVIGGVYAYDTGGTINRTLIDSKGNQAFRPGTESTSNVYTSKTPWTVTDSYLRVPQGVPPAHTEAAQVLGGDGLTFRNVVFDTGGPFNNTQTADLNFIGANLRCEDCYFLGYGGYSIYSEGPNNVFIRPRFARNRQFGIVYPNSVQKATLIDPRYLDGSPA